MNTQLIWKYQAEIHKRLVNFVNGDSMNNLSKLTYPLIDSNKNDLSVLLSLAEEIVASDFQINKSVSILRTARAHVLTTKRYAEILSVLFSEFYEKLKSKKYGFQKIIVSPAMRFMQWCAQPNAPSKMVHELRTFFQKNIRNLVCAFYLHGSLATLDYEMPFSDVDTLFIIKKETVENPLHLIKLRKALLAMRVMLCSFDPLQHHGFPIIAEQELAAFSRTFFPIHVIEHAVSLMDNPSNNLQVKIRDDESERLETFSNSLDYFRKMTGITKLQSVYAWKMFVSKLLLLPTLYLQAKGLFFYKRESFQEVKTALNCDWQVIERASRLRKEWPYFHSDIFSFLRVWGRFVNNPFIMSLPSLFTQFTLLDRHEKNVFVTGAYQLANIMNKKIKQGHD